MLGSLADRSLPQVWLVLPLMIPGWLMVAAAARGLDALTLGEEAAHSLGFDPKPTQWLVIGGTALAVGAAVAVTGVVGFVGLVVPHLLRGRVGQHPSRLLLPSFLGGAALTLAADLAIRLMPPGPELKLGVVTALLGAPFFLHLVLHARRSFAP
jgi:iron complex transport system permease protein